MEENVVTLKLNINDINLIVKQLSKMKYKKSVALINDIQRQAMSQVSAQMNNEPKKSV